MFIHWVSESVTRTLGWQPEQFAGNPVRTFVHPEDFPGLRQAVMNSDRNKSVKHDARWRRTDGSYLWMSGLGRLVTESDGTVVGRVVGLRNIHDQTLAQQSLAANEQHCLLPTEGASSV